MQAERADAEKVLRCDGFISHVHLSTYFPYFRMHVASLYKRIAAVFQQPYRLHLNYFFLLLAGMVLFVLPGNILDFGYATLEKFFQTAPWILLVLIPAITMRSFSEEFRTGTFEILQTVPISRWQLVSGKYFASLIVVLIAIIPTLIYPFSLQQLSTDGGIDTGGTAGSYIGLILLSASFVAIGTCCSSLTNNAVVAFIVSAFLCVVVYGAFTAISRIPVFEGGLIIILICWE